MQPEDAKRRLPRRLADLVDQAIDILDRHGLAQARCEHFRDFCNNARERYLQVGVVGITSSGKSSFINALMGEALIPEETRPTSNVLFYCGWGAAPCLSLTGVDGSVQTIDDAASFAEIIRTHATETGNPDNRKGVAAWSCARLRC